MSSLINLDVHVEIAEAAAANSYIDGFSAIKADLNLYAGLSYYAPLLQRKFLAGGAFSTAEIEVTGFYFALSEMNSLKRSKRIWILEEVHLLSDSPEYDYIGARFSRLGRPVAMKSTHDFCTFLDLFQRFRKEFLALVAESTQPGGITFPPVITENRSIYAAIQGRTDVSDETLQAIRIAFLLALARLKVQHILAASPPTNPVLAERESDESHAGHFITELIDFFSNKYGVHLKGIAPVVYAFYQLLKNPASVPLFGARLTKLINFKIRD